MYDFFVGSSFLSVLSNSFLSITAVYKYNKYYEHIKCQGCIVINYVLVWHFYHILFNSCPYKLFCVFNTKFSSKWINCWLMKISDNKYLQQHHVGPVYDSPQIPAGVEFKMELKENVCYAKTWLILLLMSNLQYMLCSLYAL